LEAAFLLHRREQLVRFSVTCCQHGFCSLIFFLGPGQLSHSRILAPLRDGLLGRASTLVMPHLAALGALLSGEKLDWSIKEIRADFLQPGRHVIRLTSWCHDRVAIAG
jgi:hypothetical protein